MTGKIEKHMIIAHAKDRLETKEDSPLLWDFIEEILSLEEWSEIARCKASRGAQELGQCVQTLIRLG